VVIGSSELATHRFGDRISGIPPPVTALDPAPPHVTGVSHRFLDVDGHNVHVAEAGSGDPVVLLHGWPQHWFCWRRLVPMLADRYRLIMPDLRGHGWSGAPRDGYEKEQLATDLLGLLDALGLDQVRLVGHDWGGWTGFLACLRRPERFRSFLALGIVHPFQRPTWAKAAQAWRGAYQLALATPVLAAATLRASPQPVGAAIRAGTVQQHAFTDRDLLEYGTILQQPARAHASVQMYRTFVFREVPRLARYRDQHLVVPTQLVVGEYDPVSSRALLDGWQDHAPAMTVARLPKVGHFVPEEAPHDVAAAVNQMA
jgi:pimeloyl-ACP methyl ester carboxylesterase